MAKAAAITDQCPVEIGLNILGGKWKLKILWQISKGAVRFNELQRRFRKITTKTLTQQIRELEDQKIIQLCHQPVMRVSILQMAQIDAILPQIIFFYGFNNPVKRCGKSFLVLWQGSLELKCV